MIRKLALFAPFAVLALSACDGPSALTKAQPGECYAVTGRQSNGEPKWEKTPCAADLAAPTPIAALPPIESATPPAPVVPPACPTAKPVSCPPASASTGRVTRSSARGVESRRSKVTIRSRGGRGAEPRDYARVPQDDGYLLGGPDVSRGDHYSYRSDPYAPPMPPLPPTERYLGRDYGRDHGERAYEYERYPGDDDFVPPPPPYARDRDRSHGGGHGYSERHDYRGEYGSREEGYSYRSEESSSSYSSRSSGSHGRRGPCCDRDRGTMAPMNGPHFPVDQDGFLTWRGKTPD